MHPIPISALLPLLFFLLASIEVPTTLCADNGEYSNCSITMRCGNIENIDYPFWGVNRASYCGRPGFELKCEDEVAKLTMIENTLRILDVIPERQILKVAREDYRNGYCPSKLVNTTIDFTHFDYGPSLRNLTLFYGCFSPLINNILPNNCTIDGTTMDVSYATTDHRNDLRLVLCRGSVIVPVYETAAENLERNPFTVNIALSGGFELQWVLDSGQCRNCRDSDGVCGYNHTTDSFICFCRDHTSETICQPTQDVKNKFPLVAGLGLAGAVLTGTGIGMFILLFRQRNRTKPLSPTTNLSQLRDNKRVRALIEKYGSLAPKIYSYSHVKKMTRAFTDKLGQGGYGSVYKGKLPDGKLIAVKVLSESKGNGEEFINEVASIGQTSHVNVVKLVGFCCENSKRALIYEYMSNGSLDRFIYDKKHQIQNTSTDLEWGLLYQITLGIARGLEYLHQGCNTRILHFDIKPHNILLDEEFRPRISDFGLAKLCQRQESIISMLGARGTAGYMAPEVYNRSFGGVSYKSDVYSFGMMVLEMAGGRRNIDVDISHTSEIYFPQWIYKQLEFGQDLELRGIVTEDDEKMARKMILVGLWCIQINPTCRPSMTRVVEMLEGSLQSLETPPQPYLSSPARDKHTSSPSSTS